MTMVILPLSPMAAPNYGLGVGFLWGQNRTSPGRPTGPPRGSALPSVSTCCSGFFLDLPLFHGIRSRATTATFLQLSNPPPATLLTRTIQTPPTLRLGIIKKKKKNCPTRENCSNLTGNCEILKYPWVSVAVNLMSMNPQRLPAHQWLGGPRVPPRCWHHPEVPLCPPRPRCPDPAVELHLYASRHIQKDQAQLLALERDLCPRIWKDHLPRTVGGPER